MGGGHDDDERKEHMLNVVEGGIVDSVKAVRNGSDEVLYLNATIHLDFDGKYKSIYGSKVTQDWVFPLPMDTAVQPGDVVAVQVQITSPFGQRFMPALEVGSNDEQEDA